MKNVPSDAIRVRAFALWEAAGRPEGHAVDYWLAAEQALSNEDDAALPGAAEAGPEMPPPAVTGIGAGGTKSPDNVKSKAAAKVAAQPAVPVRPTRAGKSRTPTTHATGR